MNTSGNDKANQAGGAGEDLHVDKVRDLIHQIKSDDAIKAHDEELSDHIAAIEEELGRDEPHHPTLKSLLDGLRTTSLEATEALINSGAMTLLNEILGTGVPPVGP
ncbi:MAG: hypothetical protein ACHQAY_05905 [Hyphomicrobiales bacterium]